jgi:protein-S-isoprenylcysteine O-methyltransferase Ste14
VDDPRTYRIAHKTVRRPLPPYRYIRRPSYTGTLMTLVGIALVLRNWAGLLALMGCTAVAYSYRITVEERALTAALGEPYKQYMQRTRRIVPFLFYDIQ